MGKTIFGFESQLIRELLDKYIFHFCFIVKHFCWLTIKRLGVKCLTLHTRQGVFTVNTRDNAIGRSLFTKGQFEYDFSLQALTFLKEKGFVSPQAVTLFDVGANIGIISVGLLCKGLVAKAVLVEPEPNNFDLLLKNIEANGLKSKTICMPFALGDSNGVLDMEISPDNLGDHRVRRTESLVGGVLGNEAARQKVKVNVVSLKELMGLPQVVEKNWTFENPVLWIDVQGFEGYVFNGAKEYLSKGIPTVSEVWPEGIRRAGMSLDEFCGIVKTYWDSYWVLRNGRFVRYPVSVFDCYLDEVNEGDGNVIFTKELDSHSKSPDR